MPFSPKDWRNAPDTSTPVSAESLEDMENRLSSYSDDVAQAGVDALSGFETVGVTGGLRGEVVPQNTPAVWGVATRALTTAARTWIMRYSPARELVITLAKWDVTVAASTDQTCELALYSGDLTTRLATSGVQAGQLNATGVKGVSISVTVDPALVYYWAFTAPVSLLAGTGASVNGRTSNSIPTMNLFCPNPAAPTVPTALAGFIDSLSSPLPTSITAASVSFTTVNTFPLIVLREV